MKPVVALAKLSPPRLSGALPRERLFGELDRIMRRPALWVWAPPGAGKTTLLATFAEARGLHCLWFDIDCGDRDLPSFFRHLALAAGVSARRSRCLPAPSGSGATDLDRFARDYFRKLFAGLVEPALLVFDSYEESDTPELAEVLRIGMEQLPGHVNMAVLARHPPSAGFARLQADGRLALLAPEALRLTPEEGAALGLQVGLLHDIGIALHRQAQGWAAGMRLLLEQVRRAGAVEATALADDSLQGVFDVFAQQLFERAPGRAQRILLDLALLPDPTRDMACTLCQDEMAGDVLEHLAQRHLFVERRRIASGLQDEECVYAFHGLFRAFLRHQLLRLRGADQARLLALRSARLLEQRGRREEALASYLQAREWTDCVRVLAVLAPGMLQEGRAAVLAARIGELPAAALERDAALHYWMGRACAAHEPRVARDWLQRAFELARDSGDGRCAIQAAAALIETALAQYASIEPLGRWVPALAQALDAPEPFDDGDAELRALTALFGGTLYLHGDDASLVPLAQRLCALLSECADANLAAAACTWLLSYASNLGKLELAGQVLARARPLLDDPAVTPMRKGVCAYFVGWTHVAGMDLQRAEDACVRLEQLGSQPGMGALLRYPAVIRFWMHALRHGAAGMHESIAAYDRTAQPAQPYDVSTLHMMRGYAAMMERRPASALQWTQVALAAYDRAGSPWHRLLARAVITWACIELDDLDQAGRTLAQMRDIGARVRLRLYDVYVLQAEARLALERPEESAAAALRRLFSSARRHGVGHPMRFLPGWLPLLCDAALRHGIECGYVKSLVRTYRLPAPAPDLERWPWPIRIRVLGGFQIEIDDQPLTFAAKAPRKALALLKAMICLGRREVRDHQLIDALWAEDEADGARAAFNVTLHRLRRLLEDVDAIIVHEGCLALNRQRVWVDAYAFEHLLCQHTVQPHGAAEDIERALELYRGPLLPADREENWAAAARERLRAKFIHHIARHAQRLEETGRRDDAVALYLRGLDADGLSEVFYQGLMRCHRDAGRPAEALILYQRFRQTLSASLGIQPSHETDALAGSIGAPLSRAM